jgi:magnesium transporter
MARPAAETAEASPAGAVAVGGIASDHATRRIPVAAADDSVAEVLDRMRGRSFELAHWIAVLDGGRFIGVAPLEGLLIAERHTPIAAIMDPDPPVVGPDERDEVAAARLAEHGRSVVVVIDEDGRFLGLVPALPMLEVLVHEHEQDLARIGGFVTGTRRARAAAEERVGRRLLHRLPWLLLGLVGAMVSAALIGAFESELDETILLALFVPAVVYLADAVGTQTEALLIRGLAVKLSLGTVIRRELLTGLIMGLIMGALFVPFAYLGWGDPDVAIAVGLALFAACSIATLVAMGLPLTFQRLGLDPAFGSGPLATVIQDLLSIAVYLAIAIPIAG